MKPGKNTRAFGKEITQIYEPKYKIFYDHGEKVKNKNVFRCKGFYGNDVENVNRLSNVDLIIANISKYVKVLIEIEERASSPKKIIGDIFSIAMCNKVGIAINKKNQEYFKITKNTYLIVGGVIPIKGKRKDKIEIIKQRIKIFKRKDDGLDLNKVELYFDEKLEDVLTQIRRKLKKILAK